MSKYELFLHQWFQNPRAPDWQLITEFKKDPFGDTADYPNKLLSGSLRRGRYVFAEYLYSVGATADTNIFTDYRLREHILRYAVSNKAFLRYVIEDHTTADWINTFVLSIDTDTHVETFLEVIRFTGGDQWNEKRKSYVVDRHVLHLLIQRHRLIAIRRLLALGMLIPNYESLVLLYNATHGNRYQPQAPELSELFYKAMNKAKWSKKGNTYMQEWQQESIRFHALARGYRTLLEIAVIQCAKANVPYTTPEPTSWHLRQDLYAIEKYKRLIRGV